MIKRAIKEIVILAVMYFSIAFVTWDIAWPVLIGGMTPGQRFDVLFVAGLTNFAIGLAWGLFE